MTPSLWPRPAQEALLLAALGDGDEALGAFETWLGQVDLEREIDGGSYRLLPLLHANLARLGCKHALMPKLAGVYRRSWCEAQTRYRQLARPLALLQDEGIPIMLSKGIVLALHHYPSPGMRPMSDVDVVVPREQALFALELLEDAGWTMPADARDHWRGRRKDMLALVTGINLNHETAGELDLQWRLVHDCLHDSAERRFWQNAVPISIDDRHVLRPSASDLLFHVIIHGTRPNELSPIRWIADAAMILRREGDAIDWKGMFAFASRMRLRYRLGLGLAYLHEAMKLDLPQHIATAARVRPGWLERLEERGDRALVRGSSVSGKLSPVFLAFLARLVTSDGRRALPRLTLNWLKLRLRRVQAPHVPTAS